MKPIGLILTGLLLGGAASHFLTRGYEALDAGTSYTYRCVQLDHEANARDAAEAIIELLLNSENAHELEHVITEAGWRVDGFSKGDHSIIMALPPDHGMGLEFVRTASGQIDLQPLPGSPGCTENQARRTTTDPTE
ncbi:hypothetical protein K3X41_14785 [Aliiroseovarius crassostreae]|uniref:hypothetical protein n=1 Tax=Aliiroseovarius crassostreae TaxID=154981 RepID=UPI002205DFC5|nr:hypothetical protein [Aliiroseovarius crassostreae]UWP98566.1 hypothetical protein K3X53_14790 [Aliiroseovarius crassostreae]UWQ07992.1 hypothetical protein K3X25_14900 [Aliiroseovarius crassostreae]UWQ11097.1 hypothetical protein K3X41_14785 [Aliiroseovarius crassostreae]